MNLFFDLRLRYFVLYPGQEQALETLEFKAGDGEEVVLQYGRSPEPDAPSGVSTAAQWTAETLPGGHTHTLGIKADGDYSDGDLLTSNATWVEDGTEKTYTGTLDFNTTAINDLLERGDADDTNDVANIEDAQLELTFKTAPTSKPRSSVKPVTVTIHHDILYGDEGTPVNAGDPDQYSLVSDTIQYLTNVTSQTGGTSADLDAVVTTTRAVGECICFLDADTGNAIRIYELASGTDAEDAPEVIRPDDFSASTNQKVWKLQSLNPGSMDMVVLSQSGTANLTADTWTKRSVAELVDTGSICTVTSGAFTLPVGDYRIRGSAAGYNCGHHYLRLRNTTQSTTAVTGKQAYSQIAPPKTETIDCVADVASSLDGLYFLMWDEDGSVAFWIDVGNTGTTAPALTVDRFVEITGITANDSATAVATAVASAIDGDSAFSATSSTSTVTVTHADDLPQYPGTAGDSGFTLAVTGSKGTGTETSAEITGRFSVTSASDSYEIQHYAIWTATNGQGSFFNTSPISPTAIFEIEKEH